LFSALWSKRSQSYPPHNDNKGVPRAKTIGAYFYSGNNNGQWSLLNQGYTHRWSGTKDHNGDTYCVKRTDEIATSFVYQGHTLVRTAVSGGMTTKNVEKACAKVGLKPVCDNYASMNGRCVLMSSTSTWAFSNPSENRQYGISEDIVRGAYFYTGGQNSWHQIKQNTGYSSRWSHFKDQDGDTFCTAPNLKKYSFKFQGFQFTRTPVKGMMTNDNILTACKAAGLKPVCDYPTSSYNDGKCEKVKSYNWYVV
jgi:hypothetical protein